MANVLTTTTAVTVSVQGIDAAGNAVNNVKTVATTSNTTPTSEAVYPYVLSTGYNSIAVPAGGYKKATIMPPAANGITLTLKGVTGDTGIALDPAGFTTIGLASGATTIGLTAGSGVTVQIQWS